MVLGLKSKKKGTKFKVEYYVNVQMIKPWPLLSQSLNSVQLQWVNGNKSSGLLSTSVVNGMVEFNESFVLRVTLRKEKKTHNVFLKNNLEFYLYESQQEKLGRGQLLGTAILNLADYGVIRENINITVPLNCKKIAKSSVAQPVLFLNVQPSDMESSTPSLNGSLSNETSLGGGEDDDDRSEVASFTDDEVSSHSSKTFTSLSPLRKEFTAQVTQGKGKFHENYQLSARYANVDKTPTPIPTESIYSELEAMTSYDSLLYGKEKKEPQANGHTTESLFGKSPTISARKSALRSETLTSRRLEEKSKSSSKLKHMKSVQISFNSARINGLFGVGIQKTDKTKETDNQQEDVQNNATIEEKGSTSVVANEWKSKVNMLEEELKETAVLEAALYSIVSEHCSSTNKVHSPARRLSRFYIHACKSTSLATKASAAKAAVSGFILVSRSCGNDVPRLTFWLSNLIMMRATVNQAVGNVSSSCENVKSNNSGCGKFVRTHEKMNPDKKQPLIQELDDWEHPQTFITAMEKIEAWIFFRIVESVWWQTLTPHMQPKSGKNICKRSNSRKTRYVLGGQEQGSSSIELWRKVFKDAGERLCPTRAGGHECGCLPVISQLVMEQLVNRLDVAMFNAILRESADEMPTDPISDPITDSRVLPIPAGKSGFGAGAQLKNAVGNWSRWLTDLFGVEDIDSLEENDSQEDDNKPTTMTAFKSFRLLNALSELMMLPIGMLADDSTRKEVCPLLGPMIIKRVLHNFVPDEFSPRPIPRAVFNSLDSEVGDEEEEEEELTMITKFPCIAGNGAGYLPPLATVSAEVAGVQTLQRTTSSILKKSYTSDDELDELDSPLTSINLDKPRQTNYPASMKPNWMPRGGRNSVRYQLLRQVWKEAQ